MDTNAETFRAKYLIVGVLLFLVSGCLTYTEANLYLRGNDGQANVVQAFETRGRRGSTRLTVEYEFTDGEGNRRKEQSTVSRSTPVPGPGGKIAIRYTNGANGSSRLAGHVNWVGVVLFGVSLAIIVFGIFVLMKEERATRPARRRPE